MVGLSRRWCVPATGKISASDAPPQLATVAEPYGYFNVLFTFPLPRLCIVYVSARRLGVEAKIEGGDSHGCPTLHRRNHRGNVHPGIAQRRRRLPGCSQAVLGEPVLALSPKGAQGRPKVKEETVFTL